MRDALWLDSVRMDPAYKDEVLRAIQREGMRGGTRQQRHRARRVTRHQRRQRHRVTLHQRQLRRVLRLNPTFKNK